MELPRNEEGNMKPILIYDPNPAIEELWDYLVKPILNMTLTRP
jgi:hypothetical protein